VRRVGVAFFRQGNWLHCGFTDGTSLIDSQPGVGVSMGPLPGDYSEILWLDAAEGEAAWHEAWTRIGDRFEICAAFVCQCMGGACLLPSNLERRLRKASR
jgi:hypothetical protein